MPQLTALDLARMAAIKPPARDLVTQAQSARHYLDLLQQAGYWTEAIAYLAHALSLREGIWWGWYCARKAAALKEDPAVTAGLALVETWIGQPTDDNRGRAWQAKPQVPTSAASLLLEAVYFSGDTVNDGTGERVPALPQLAQKHLQAAVITAVYALNGDDPGAAAQDLLRQGAEVANRINLWVHYA